MKFARRTNWSLATNRLTETLDGRRRRGAPILDLTVGNPTECGFQYDAPRILEAFRQTEALRYSPEPLGLLSAREAVSFYYRERNAQLPPEQILLTTSTSEAYSFLFRLLCDPGDEILIASPSYPLFDFLADIQDVSLTRYPLLYDHSWHVDLHTLESRISQRTRAIVVVHPNNPTGNYCPAGDAAALRSVCRKHDLALVADEVFLDFAVDGESRLSFAANSEALTFTLSGVSKICGLPQAKLAWLAVTGPVNDRRAALAKLELISDTYLSLSAPAQLAAPTLLETRDLFRAQILARIRANLSQLDSVLGKRSDCSRLEVQGGWNVVVRVPRTRSDEELAVALLETSGVLIHPGYFYDFSEEGYVVLSLITPPQIFGDGVSRLFDLF